MLAKNSIKNKNFIGPIFRPDNNKKKLVVLVLMIHYIYI